MADKPVIIKRNSQSHDLIEKTFSFKPDFSVDADHSKDFRKKAWQAYNDLPFPSRFDAAWRRTDLAKLPLESFKEGEETAISDTKIPQELLIPVADNEHGGQIVIDNGNVIARLESNLQEQGVIFTDLRTAWQKNPELLEKIAGQLIRPEEDKFAALSFAMAKNGVFLYVPKNVKVENPLHSLWWISGENIASLMNVFILLDEGAEVTYVHETASAAGETSDGMHAGVMEIHVGEGASLRFVELQSLGENMWNFTHERVNVERDGKIDWVFGALGSKVTKNFTDLNLTGEGSSGKVSGFYFTHGKQHLDHQTRQNHLARNTMSDLLFKGALVGDSRSVWQGMIYVAENALKADGYQANRNLLLGDRSHADSIPGLEILTDDVRCTHGATVGKIDAEQLFYLESRGLTREDAERVIVEGFFDPIMQRIPFEGVKNRFQRAILEKMQDL
jgi:Fe-S cluster assembly protein SufD